MYFFRGPTYFAPVIKEFKRRAEQNNNNYDFNYNISLIISDGYLQDINETIDSIIEASILPISFIIIGVGVNVNRDTETPSRILFFFFFFFFF